MGNPAGVRRDVGQLEERRLLGARLLRQGVHPAEVARQELGPQIHAISDETHRQIHACLLIARKNWKRRCSNESTVAKRTGDLLRLHQGRQRHLLRPPDTHPESGQSVKALTFGTLADVAEISHRCQFPLP